MKLFKNFNFDRLKEGLAKSSAKITNRIAEVLTGKAKLDEEILEELEEILITSDLGVDTVAKVIDELKVRLKSSKERSEELIYSTVENVLIDTLKTEGITEFSPDIENKKPFVILIVGVNGAGKTTTIGKLAYNFKNSGLSVAVGAADTFRAAANEQLEIWANRVGIPIISKGQGADPSSVAFETVEYGIKNSIDILLIDTAGRLHTKSNLMEELNKINRVIAKILPGAPHETLLVLDGNTGQNALNQAEEFFKSVNLTGLIFTKLDGTAKGGALFQIVSKLKKPVRFIGVGEKIDDLQTFSAVDFVKAILNRK